MIKIKIDTLADSRFTELTNRQKMLYLACMENSNEDGEFRLSVSDANEYGIFYDNEHYKSVSFYGDMQKVVNSGLLPGNNMSTVYSFDEVVRTKEDDTFTSADTNFVKFVLDELKALNGHYMRLTDDLMLICPELDVLKDTYCDDDKELHEAVRETIASGKLDFNYIYTLEEGGENK